MNRILITKPSITEREIKYVDDAIKNGWGERCYEYIRKFEQTFCNHLQTKHSLATSSCTGALHLALLALEIGEGDEVIVPDSTWIASVEPVLYTGASPVFVDVLPDTWCINPSKIKLSITPKTKAIIVVHLYGNSAEMDEIMQLASEHNLFVIEDAAEAIGSEYKNRKLGSIADIGVFSFHGTKTVSCGEGGILVTNNSSIYQRCTILNDHGRDPKNQKAFWMAEYGYKYKMSNLQAAMGCAQLERLEELVKKKREIFNWYFQLFSKKPGIQLNQEQTFAKNSYWMPTLVFSESFNLNRDSLIAYLKERNIDSRPFFYPLSSLPIFEPVNNPIAYNLSKNGINLPSYFDLTFPEVKYVFSTIMEYLNKHA